MVASTSTCEYLAMSMMQQQPSHHPTGNDVKIGDNDDIAMISMMNEGSQTLSSFDQQSFDALMWDEITTTPNDKQRWLCECIVTSFLLRKQQQQLEEETAAAAATSTDTDCKNNNVPPITTWHQATPLEVFTGIINVSRSNENSTSANILLHNRKRHLPSSSTTTEVALDTTTNDTDNSTNVQGILPSPLLSSSTRPVELWGLIQKQGGPCGVLAAVQAEMIRIVLFGRAKRSIYRKSSSGSSREEMYITKDRKNGYYLYYPHELSSSESSSNDDNNDHIPPPITEREANEVMAMAIGMILARAALYSSTNTPKSVSSSAPTSSASTVKLILPTNIITSTNNDCEDESMVSIDFSSSSNLTSNAVNGLTVHVISQLTNSQDRYNYFEGDDYYTDQVDDAMKVATLVKLTPGQRDLNSLAMLVADFLLTNRQGSLRSSTIIDYFQRPGGVMYLVMSLVTTRGIDRIRDDMDDPNATITSQFGHTSQELMNLLLTGQAVSNVFDNSMILSDELTCSGIQSRSDIGYLSALESLRYCTVGSYYKTPKFPIWVIGSTSHFTVLFGDECCLKESKSDLLLETCRRAFQKVDGGLENGFITVDKLGLVLGELDLKSGDDAWLSTLQAYLEVAGAGIILWDDFWRACSRLMTGASLEMIMQDNKNNADIGPPLLITPFGEEPMTSVRDSTHQSDEEYARKLAEEWGSLPNQREIPTEIIHSVKSDEDCARELQAMWDAELTAAGQQSTGESDTLSNVATTDDIVTLDSDDENFALISNIHNEGKTEKGTDATSSTVAKDTSNKEKPWENELEFEMHWQSFSLCHYNGLHNGTLTQFKLTRLSPIEAVGASISLSSKGGNGHRTGGYDLEDVVRTKWPSCQLNWFGKRPPSID